MPGCDEFWREGGGTRQVLAGGAFPSHIAARSCPCGPLGLGTKHLPMYACPTGSAPGRGTYLGVPVPPSTPCSQPPTEPDPRWAGSGPVASRYDFGGLLGGFGKGLAEP